jgi:putative transposase
MAQEVDGIAAGEAVGIGGCDQQTEELLRAGVRISMDGNGRVFDNILMERFWRTLKQEEVYQKRYESVMASREGIGAFVMFYNHERLHAALAYRTPAEVYGVTPNQVVA